MTRVYGVDGCRNGWAVVAVAADGPLEPAISWRPTLAGLVGRATVAVDIPIGLPERIDGPGRAPEQSIRPLLRSRRSSVFSIPSRAAVFADNYEEACRIARQTSSPSRAISIQAFKIFPLIREVDGLLTTKNQHRVFEVHAELAFWRLNGNTPMAEPKLRVGVPASEQLQSRIAILQRYGFPPEIFGSPLPGIPLVDVVDAAAIALIARRCHCGAATPFPDPPPVDGRGLRLAIWA